MKCLANRWTCLAILGAAVSVACSDSEGGRLTGPGGDQLFSVTVTQFGPESSTAGLVTTDDPAKRTALTLDRAIELSGSAAAFGRERNRSVIVGTSDGPTLTRYLLGNDDVFRPDVQLSFEAYGISSGFKRPGLVPTVATDKAYWLDDNSLQGIIWNPEAMTVSGTFSFAEAKRDGVLLEFGEDAVLRGDQLFIPANYRTADEGEAGTALVLVVDTKTDQLVKVLEDERCGSTLSAVLDPDGTIYVATSTLGATFYAIGLPADYPEPCVLRIAPGQTEFDPAFKLSLVQMAGGRPAGDLLRGKAGNYYFSALFEEELGFEVGSADDIYAEWDATAWRLFRFRFDQASAPSPMTELPLSSGAGGMVRADGVEYVVRVRDDLSKASFYVPQEDGSFTSGIEVPGVPYSLLRVR